MANETKLRNPCKHPQQTAKHTKTNKKIENQPKHSTTTTKKHNNNSLGLRLLSLYSHHYPQIIAIIKENSPLGPAAVGAKEEAQTFQNP